jgi:hypothetical protein
MRSCPSQLGLSLNVNLTLKIKLKKLRQANVNRLELFSPSGGEWQPLVSPSRSQTLVIDGHHLEGDRHTPVDFRSLKDEGDEELYTAENLRRREAIKHDPMMSMIVKKFWHVLDMAKDANGCISRTIYTQLNIRLHKALIPDICVNEATKEANDDWERDSQGQETMAYDMFFLAMFELADLWCLAIDCDRYVKFLEQVFSHVVMLGKDGVYRWREVADIDFMAEETKEKEDEEARREAEDEARREAEARAWMDTQEDERRAEERARMMSVMGTGEGRASSNGKRKGGSRSSSRNGGAGGSSSGAGGSSWEDGGARDGKDGMGGQNGNGSAAGLRACSHFCFNTYHADHGMCPPFRSPTTNQSLEQCSLSEQCSLLCFDIVITVAAEEGRSFCLLRPT